MVQLFLPELIVLGAFALFSLIPWLIWRRRKPPDRRLTDTALARGLTIRSGVVGDLAEGQLDGFGVSLRYIDTQRPPRKDEPWGPPSAHCRTTITLPGPLPSGLRMSSMGIAQTVLQGLGAQDIEIGDRWLDQSLRIRAERPEEARILLADPDVRGALQRATISTADAIEVTPTQVRLVRSGISVPDAGVVLDLALDVAHALTAASQGVWEDLAETLGLDTTAAPRGALLSGVRRGVPLSIRLSTDEDGDPTTRLDAAFSAPLPGGLRLRSRRPESTATSTGNPILDLRAEVHTTDPAACRALLADAALTGPLLELLDVAPGVRILPDGIKLTLPGWPTADLTGLLDLIAEVAAGLEAARPEARSEAAPPAQQRRGQESAR